MADAAKLKPHAIGQARFLSEPVQVLRTVDSGAGKTIMVGLLIKELKVRGLLKRTLIVTPAHFTFQWQREMKDKVQEDFEIVRGDVLRSHWDLIIVDEAHKMAAYSSSATELYRRGRTMPCWRMYLPALSA